MINTFDVGKVVYDRLSSIEAVGNKVYPLIAENSTTFPFIVYQRDSITGEFCKDGIVEDRVSMTIRVVSATYFEGLEIAQAVRQNLTLYNFEYQEENVVIFYMTSRMVSAFESFEENSYIQTLTFEMNINN